MSRKLLIFLLVCFSVQADEIPLKETLARIQEMISKEEKGAYFCFSEADIKIASGHGDCIWDQLEMEQVLSLEGENILKSSSLPYTALNGHRTGERWAADLFHRIGDDWGSSYAALSSALLSTTHRKESSRFLRFLQSKNLVIVGDVEIPRPTQDLLFGPDSRFVSVENSEWLELEKYTVVILAAASNEKALSMKWLDGDLPVFILDFCGLRDAMANWSTETWEKWMRKSDCIKILYTSALIPYKFEERKGEYIKCLEILKNYGFLDRTYIAESGPYTPLSFFDEYASHVLYANTNDTSLINKGVNEVKASLAAFDYFGFNDEDMIIKLTGRYLFNNDNFLRLVEAHPEVDAFGSRFEGPFSESKITTGCFAMRCKYYKRMLQEIDLAEMERDLIDIERVAETFLKKMISENAKVVYVDKIGITANVANVVVEQW